MLAELERLSTTPGAYAFVVLLGLLWGSFANVCIYRWPPSDEFPHGRSVVRPGSHCFACKTPIKWYDNMPLVAWLWLRGKCRNCKAPFSSRYLVVEAVTGALFGFAWYWMVDRGMWWDEAFDYRLVRWVIAAAFCFVMVVITFIDLDHKLILNKLTIPSIVAFYLLSLVMPERAWWEGLVGIAVGYGFPWLVGEVYYRLRGAEGLGLGDSMLLAVVGALLGWKGVLVSLFGGSVLGVVLGLPALLIARRRAPAGESPTDAALAGPAPNEGSPDDGPPDDGPPDDGSMLRAELPFGPFLAMGALFYLFAEQLLQIHFRLPGG